MRFGSRALLAVTLGLAAAFVVACGSSSGGSGLLSQAQNSTISSELSAISGAVSAGSCSRASSAVARLEDTLARLPAGVDQSLAHNLGQGATTVKSLALTDCQTAQHTTSSSSTTATSTTPSTPTSVSTPTTTSQTATQPTTSSTPTQPTTQSTTPVTPPASATTNGGAGLAPGAQ